MLVREIERSTNHPNKARARYENTRQSECRRPIVPSPPKAGDLDLLGFVSDIGWIHELLIMYS